MTTNITSNMTKGKAIEKTIKMLSVGEYFGEHALFEYDTFAVGRLFRSLTVDYISETMFVQPTTSCRATRAARVLQLTETLTTN